MNSPSVEAPLTETAERRAIVGAPGSTPDSKWVIVTRGIKREYDMGGEIVRALRGIDLAIGRNELPDDERVGKCTFAPLFHLSF